MRRAGYFGFRQADLQLFWSQLALALWLPEPDGLAISFEPETLYYVVQAAYGPVNLSSYTYKEAGVQCCSSVSGPFGEGVLC